MSYENPTKSVTAILSMIGATLDPACDLDETYGLDLTDVTYDNCFDDETGEYLLPSDPELHPSWEMAHDSMSTFDHCDYEYMQSILY